MGSGQSSSDLMGQLGLSRFNLNSGDERYGAMKSLSQEDIYILHNALLLELARETCEVKTAEASADTMVESLPSYRVDAAARRLSTLKSGEVSVAAEAFMSDSCSSGSSAPVRQLTNSSSTVSRSVADNANIPGKPQHSTPPAIFSGKRHVLDVWPFLILCIFFSKCNGRNKVILTALISDKEVQDRPPFSGRVLQHARTFAAWP